jgi:hypothetical protein
MFDGLRNSYNEYIYTVTRRSFEKALAEGDYIEALFLAERNTKRMRMTQKDMDELLFGLDGYMLRAERLQQRLHGEFGSTEKKLEQRAKGGKK